MAKEVQEAIREALSSAEGFAAVLHAEGQEGLANRFAAIAAHLREGELGAAITDFDRGSYSGPGGLNDLYALDQSGFDAAWGRCASSLHALKRAIAS